MSSRQRRREPVGDRLARIALDVERQRGEHGARDRELAEVDLVAVDAPLLAVASRTSSRRAARPRSRAAHRRPSRCTRRSIAFTALSTRSRVRLRTRIEACRVEREARIGIAGTMPVVDADWRAARATCRPRHRPACRRSARRRRQRRSERVGGATSGARLGRLRAAGALVGRAAAGARRRGGTAHVRARARPCGADRSRAARTRCRSGTRRSTSTSATRRRGRRSRRASEPVRAARASSR